MPNLDKINTFLKQAETLVNDESPGTISGNWQAGIDLGTADIVLTVVDEKGSPLAVFMEWAEVVRDGIVLDFYGATQIVKRLVEKAEQKLSVTIERAITSYPPGTDPRISGNVIESAGLEVEAIIDEPSSVINLLGINDGAVVDIGGGTTGISVVRDGQIIYTADEPTGGRHATLVIAGNKGISYEEAEKIKTNGSADSIMPLIRPVFEKMADIAREHLEDKGITAIYLAGGSSCFKGIDTIFRRELDGMEIILPYNPLYLTPLAIASYRQTKDNG